MHRWIAADPSDLLWVRFADGGAALYHRPSGRTHFLNPTSVVLIERLNEKAATAEELAAGLAGQGDVRFAADVASVIDRFEQVGLVRRQRP